MKKLDINEKMQLVTTVIVVVMTLLTVLFISLSNAGVDMLEGQATSGMSKWEGQDISTPVIDTVEGQAIAAAAGDYCASCPDATAGGDQMCEDFEITPGALCTWGAAQPNGSYDFNNTPTGSWTCEETNLENLEIVFVNADNVTQDTGSTSNTNFAVWYFKVILESLANSNSTILMTSQDSGGVVYVHKFRLAQDGSGNLFFTIEHRNDANGYTGEQTFGSSYFYTLGEEVRVRVVHDSTATTGICTWYVKIADGAEQTVAFTHDEVDNSEQLSRIFFGYGANDDDYTMEVDFVRIDDDTMPPACSGDSY